MSSAAFDRRKVKSPAELAAYHNHALALKRNAVERRVELGREYLQRHAIRDPGPILTRETAFKSVDLSGFDLMQAVLAEADEMLKDDGRLRRTKGSLDYLTGGPDYDASSAAVRLAWSPELLGPVIHYYGMMPILFNVFLTRANAKDLLRDTSHMYHVDPEDVTQVKAFVHLTPVDEGCGPFHALPANLTEIVERTLNYKRGRLADEELDQIVGPNRALASLGGPGTVTFCDTTRCLHFGGRPPLPGKPIRDILVFRYLLPTCIVYPQFEGDGETPIALAVHPQAGNPGWNAFIGAEHVFEPGVQSAAA